jgi:hypothetical protein
MRRIRKELGRRLTVLLHRLSLGHHDEPPRVVDLRTRRHRPSRNPAGVQRRALSARRTRLAQAPLLLLLLLQRPLLGRERLRVRRDAPCRARPEGRVGSAGRAEGRVAAECVDHPVDLGREVHGDALGGRQARQPLDHLRRELVERVGPVVVELVLLLLLLGQLLLLSLQVVKLLELRRLLQVLPLLGDRNFPGLLEAREERLEDACELVGNVRRRAGEVVALIGARQLGGDERPQVLVANLEKTR